MLTLKFCFIWPSFFRREHFFFISTNQKQELPMTAIFVNGLVRNEQSLQRTFHKSSYQVSIYMAKRFQGRRILEIDQPARQQQNLPLTAMFVNKSRQNEQSIQRTFHGYCLHNNRLISSTCNSGEKGFPTFCFESITYIATILYSSYLPQQMITET